MKEAPSASPLANGTTPSTAQPSTAAVSTGNGLQGDVTNSEGDAAAVTSDATGQLPASEPALGTVDRPDSVNNDLRVAAGTVDDRAGNDSHPEAGGLSRISCFLPQDGAP